MFRIRILVVLAVFLPAAIAQADAGKAICDHLAQHASDYDKDDAVACETEIVQFLSELDKAKQDQLATCVTGHTPITKEQFGECLLGIMGDDGSLGGPDAGPLPDEAEIQKLCAHLKANAEEFTPEDVAECPEGMATLAAIVGADAYKAFSACVMETPKPNQDNVEKCMESAMTNVAPEEPVEEKKAP